MLNTIPTEPVDFTGIIATYFPNAKAPAARTVVPDADKSFFQRVNDHAMADLASWVPELFPHAERARTGYRVRSAQLGRDLEEDISIQPEGIVDFGIADQGDENEGKRTPTALVMEHLELSVTDAAHWLCNACILSPVELGWTEVSGVPASPDDFDELEADNLTINFTRDKKGKIEASIENTVKAVQAPHFCGAQIAFDSFRDEIMLSPPANTNGWRSITDAEYTGLRITLEQRSFKPVGKELVRDAVEFAAAHASFDSATIWLNGLEWDGTPRLEKFLHIYFGAEDNKFTRATSRYIWTALAGRILDPGCQADMMPILVGAQGSGKSTGVKTMVPSADHFFEVHLDAKEDDLARRMRGRLLGEVGELRGLHTREIEHIKAFITRTHENWVPKFKEFAHTFPRRCLFIGTTNKEEFLADETGERRFLPIDVHNVDCPGIERDRLQLWAEARELFLESGIDWQEAEALAPEVHSKHKIIDVWDENISQWLDNTPGFEEDGEDGIPRREGFFTISQIWQSALGKKIGDINQMHEKRIGKLLRHMGCIRKVARIDGKPKKVWCMDPDKLLEDKSDG